MICGAFSCSLLKVRSKSEVLGPTVKVVLYLPLAESCNTVCGLVSDIGKLKYAYTLSGVQLVVKVITSCDPAAPLNSRRSLSSSYFCGGEKSSVVPTIAR